jgi:hypothetical protein
MPFFAPKTGLDDLFAPLPGGGEDVMRMPTLEERWAESWNGICYCELHNNWPFSAFESELVALFLTLPLKNGWHFLADPDSRSFSRFGAILMQFAVRAMKTLQR